MLSEDIIGKIHEKNNADDCTLTFQFSRDEIGEICRQCDVYTLTKISQVSKICYIEASKELLRRKRIIKARTNLTGFRNIECTLISIDGIPLSRVWSKNDKNKEWNNKTISASSIAKDLNWCFTFTGRPSELICDSPQAFIDIVYNSLIKLPIKEDGRFFGSNEVQLSKNTYKCLFSKIGKSLSEIYQSYLDSVTKYCKPIKEVTTGWITVGTDLGKIIKILPAGPRMSTPLNDFNLNVRAGKNGFELISSNRKIYSKPLTLVEYCSYFPSFVYTLLECYQWMANTSVHFRGQNDKIYYYNTL